MSLYNTLHVRTSATETEIRDSYKQLCLAYHPDLKHGDSKIFSDVNYAYTILKDPDTKRLYDNFGPIALSMLGEPSYTKMICKIFSKFNLIICKLAVVLLILQVAILPLLLLMYATLECCTILYAFTPLILTSIMIFHPFIRTGCMLRNKYEFRMHHVVIQATCRVLCLITIQMVYICLKYDNLIVINNYFLASPYIMLEIYLIKQFKIVLKHSAIEYSYSTEKKYLLFLIAKIACIIHLILPLKLCIKSVVLCVYILICLYYAIGRLLIAAMLVLPVSIYLFSCVLIIYGWPILGLVLSVIPVSCILIILYIACRKWKSKLPKSMFLKQKILMCNDHNLNITKN